MKYHIFISYSTDPDYSLAQNLEGFLESFHKLPGISEIVLRPLQVCVDGSHFVSGRKVKDAGRLNDLTDIIEECLQESSKLLVLCSANSSRSKWVDAEIAWFLNNRTPDDILLAVTEGVDPATSPEGIFSERIRQSGLLAKPWYDFRGFRRVARRSALRLRDFDENRVGLAAHLLGLSVGEVQPVWFREQQRLANRRNRIAYSVGFIFLVLTVLACWFGYNMLLARRATEHELYYSSILVADRAIADGDFALAKRSLQLAPNRFRNWEWRYLDNCARKLVGSFGRMGSKILQATPSPDATQIALALDDRSHSVVLWNLRSGNVDEDFSFSNDVHTLQWSSSGKSLVVGCSDGFIHLINATTTKSVNSLLLSNSVVPAAFFAPVSQLLISISHADALTNQYHQNYGSTNGLKELVKGAMLQSLIDPIDEALKRKVHIPVIGEKQTVVTVWDAKKQIVLHSEEVTGLCDLGAIHPSRDMIAVSDKVGVIRMVDLKTFAVQACTRTTRNGGLLDELPATEDAPGEPLDWLRFSPKGRFLVSAQHDGMLELWDPSTARLVTEIKLGAPVGDIAFDDLEEQFSVTDATGTSKVFNVELNKQTAEFETSAFPARASAVSKDGVFTATCNSEGRLVIWDNKTVKETGALKVNSKTDHIYWVSPGRLVTIADDELCLWSIDGSSLRPIHPPATPLKRSVYDTADVKGDYGLHIRPALAESPNGILSTDLSANGQRLVARFSNGTIGTWDVPYGRPLAVLATGQIQARVGDAGLEITYSTAPDAWLSADGRTVLTFCPYRGFGIWNCDNGQLLAVIAHPTTVFGPAAERYGAFFPLAASAQLPAPQIDSKVSRLAYIYREYTTMDSLPRLHIVLMNVRSNKEIFRDDVPSSSAIAPHFDPSGSLLVYENGFTSLVCRNADTGKERFICTNLGNVCRGIAFSHDGRLLAMAGDNGNMLLADTATGRIKARWTASGLPPCNLLFDENATKMVGLASAETGQGTNSTIFTQATVWDLRSGRIGKPICSFSQAGVSANNWTVTPDGSRLFSADRLGIVECWDTETGRRLLSISAHHGNVDSIKLNVAQASVVASSTADQMLGTLNAPTDEGPREEPRPADTNVENASSRQRDQIRHLLQEAQALSLQETNLTGAWLEVLRTRSLCGFVATAKVEALSEPDVSRRSRALHAVVLALTERHNFDAAMLGVNQIESEVYRRLAKVALVEEMVSASRVEEAERFALSSEDLNDREQCLDVLGVALARKGNVEDALKVATHLAADASRTPKDEGDDTDDAQIQGEGKSKLDTTTSRTAQFPPLLVSSWQSPPWRSFLADVVRELSAWRVKNGQNDALDYPFVLDRDTRWSAGMTAARAAIEKGDENKFKQFFEEGLAGDSQNGDAYSVLGNFLDMAQLCADLGICEGSLQVLKQCEDRLAVTNSLNRKFLENPGFNGVSALQMWMNAAATARCAPDESSRRFELGEQLWIECLSTFAKQEGESASDDCALRSLGSEYLRNCMRAALVAMTNTQSTTGPEVWLNKFTSPRLKSIALEQIGELALEQGEEDVARAYVQKAIATALRSDDRTTEPLVGAGLCRKLGQMSAHRAFEDENWLSWINTLPASQRIYAYLGAAAEVATPSISKKIKTSDPSTSQIDSSE